MYIQQNSLTENDGKHRFYVINFNYACPLQFSSKMDNIFQTFKSSQQYFFQHSWPTTFNSVFVIVPQDQKLKSLNQQIPKTRSNPSHSTVPMVAEFHKSILKIARQKAIFNEHQQTVQKGGQRQRSVSETFGQANLHSPLALRWISAPSQQHMSVSQTHVILAADGWEYL